jgi:hypothetical protein
LVNYYAGDKETANQEIDDEDDIDEEEREDSDAMKELREVYNKLKNSSQQEKNIASSQAGIVEHFNNLNNIAEARNKANEGQEKNAIAMLNPCATKVLALLLYVFLVEQEIRIRDYLTADCDFFIFNKNLIIFFNKK